MCSVHGRHKDAPLVQRWALPKKSSVRSSAAWESTGLSRPSDNETRRIPHEKQRIDGLGVLVSAEHETDVPTSPPQYQS